jgi:predicted  nucleic acid-binding Zn-ribbon protein
MSNRTEYKKALAALIAENERIDKILTHLEIAYPELKTQNWLTSLEYRNYMSQQTRRHE